MCNLSLFSVFYEERVFIELKENERKKKNWKIFLCDAQFLFGNVMRTFKVEYKNRDCIKNLEKNCIQKYKNNL